MILKNFILCKIGLSISGIPRSRDKSYLQLLNFGTVYILNVVCEVENSFKKRKLSQEIISRIQYVKIRFIPYDLIGKIKFYII
jgi:hypothetical protein